MPFIQRMRIMHGERSGVLNLDFAPSPDPAFKPCTLRYPYVSACVRLDADADRSRHQLAPTALCDMPPTPQEASPPVPALAAMDPTAEPAAFAPSDDPAIAFGPEFSHSPVSFTTVPSNVTSLFKDPGLLPTRKTGLQKPDNVFPQNPCIEGNVACFPNPLQQQQQQHPQPQGKTATTVPPDCVPPKRQQESLSASVVSLATLQSNVDPFPSDPKIPNSLCGPDKRGRECECSAENMPDPSLALILNSRNDRHQLIDIGPSAEPVLKPAIRQNGNVRDVVLPSAPRNPNDSGDAILESDESTALGSLGSHLRFGSQGQEGNRLGASTTLPSQSRFPGLMPGEPPMKRPRSDTTQRPAPLNLSSMDQPWSSFDDHRTIPMPSWNMAVAADRPQSALARAFGMTRSPSPAGLMSGTPYVPSPPTAPLSTANFGFPQAITHQDHFMQGASFDSSVLGREADIVNQQRMQANDGVEERRDQHQKREQHHLVGDSPNTNDGTGANTNEQSVANGVQCEVCGLSFAKRSNKSRHVQTVHDGLKQFECDLCGQKFAHKADLGRHRYRIHVSRAFSCEKCGKSFAEQDQLHHHVRVTHEEDARPWECKQCQIRFGRKSSLTRHRQTVHQKTRFTCRVCSKTYSQKFDAVRHERKAHGVSCTSASASASAS
ncbi:unnamed protein product [Chondrus crispus]|uniref:C2H2-type domain-containing protein n=1 Tax=Chondrus crispus TaxID=2769 RepID=R7QMQ3_CHOCR|nr:unnamed protein product [Chondrus crispus]CDF39023.1 unnamed protein product [Chondrus crispus]|eukprot:XP_005718928.1 unnamed protein product [Chondrus crispus]